MNSKCSTCRMTLPIINFRTKRNGILNKCCDHCINKTKQCQNVSKCEHNRRLTRCKDCGGGSICEHNRQRDTCKLCNDPIKVTIITMIKNSRFSDKKNNRFDVYHFIDTDFLRGLIEDQPNCYWSDCNTPLQYITFTNNLSTIERLNNSIGHIKSNCVLACKSCNCKRKSNH
jgi:hypothetical protein